MRARSWCCIVWKMNEEQNKMKRISLFYRWSLQKTKIADYCFTVDIGQCHWHNDIEKMRTLLPLSILTMSNLLPGLFFKSVFSFRNLHVGINAPLEQLYHRSWEQKLCWWQNWAFERYFVGDISEAVVIWARGTLKNERKEGTIKGELRGDMMLTGNMRAWEEIGRIFFINRNGMIVWNWNKGYMFCSLNNKCNF